MLQNCYKLHTFVTIDGDVKSGHFSTGKHIVKSGHFSTVSDNVQNGKKSTVFDNVQDGKKSTRKYIVKSGARNDIQGPHGRGRAGVRSPVPGYIRAGRAGSWKLEAATTSWAP